jgi:50S ribosomal subunit-associated GTPase HflX
MIFSTVHYQTHNQSSEEKKENFVNLIIVGCTLSGKSTLSNILCDVDDFSVCIFINSETNNLQ